MKNCFIAFMAFLICNTLHSQSLSVTNIDPGSLPVIRAKFYAFDNSGNQIINLNKTEFELKENGQARKITQVSCPSPKPLQSVSLAMSIDVSGSMKAADFDQTPVDLGKSTASELCRLVPMPPSEFALQTCHKNALIIQDFTTDKNKILNAIAPIRADGDNDFVEQLLNRRTGLLNIAKTGKFNRVAVLYTDAWWDALTEFELMQCIDTCDKYKIKFYAIIYSRPESKPNGIKSSLQEIARTSGGMIYDGITSLEAAKDLACRLQITAQGGEPCTIEWQSGISCVNDIINVDLKLLTNGSSSKSNYQLPVSSGAIMEINPESIKFLYAVPGVQKTTDITITARNSDFVVSNIISSNPAFTIKPTSFTLLKNESRNLTVTFLPVDSGYTFTKFAIESDICPSKFYASGGFPGKKSVIKTLNLIHPNGGEVFVAGTDTVITWEGVLPEEPVTIEYRTSEFADWTLLTDTAKGLSYRFKIPKIASKNYMARVTAKTQYGNFDKDMVFIPNGSFLMGYTGVYAGYNNELPVHKVKISKDFLMSKYEVTQKLYEEVTGKNPSLAKGKDLPVENVSWFDAIEFCNMLSAREGYDLCYSGTGNAIVCDWNANGYRLPTEAEWEYACKATSTSDFYNGNLTYENCIELDYDLNKIAWYCTNSKYSTHEVGKKESNFFGLNDMSGNVWEWCWDWLDSYSSAPATDPKNTKSNLYGNRVFRGGSWKNYANHCRSSHRDSAYPYRTDSSVGFRVVRVN
jgi:formylglycine-generating enzyme required for sulfatase activity